MHRNDLQDWQKPNAEGAFGMPQISARGEFERLQRRLGGVIDRRIPANMNRDGVMHAEA